jgi:hypothetical protein
VRRRRSIASSHTGRRLALVAALLSVLPSGAATGASHCGAEEETLFTCNTGRKLVSVCGSRDLSASFGFVQYRFGPPAAPELVYPPVDADWRAVTRGSVLTYAGGGGAYLAFSSGPYRYVVYTAIGRGLGKKAGVVVEKNGKRVANLPCTSQETSELGPDLFARAGVAEDSGSFDLP